MAKKEVSTEDLVMDLLTKIRNVFRKDIYIVDSFYILGGEDSNDSLPGHFYCELVQKYKLAVEKYFTRKDVIYISDIAEFKENPSENWMEITDENKCVELRALAHAYQKSVIEAEEWRTFDALDDQTQSNIFNGKIAVIHADPYDSNSPYCIVAKKVFPLIGPKTIDKLFIAVNKTAEDSDLYALITQLDFTHFTLYGYMNFTKMETEVKSLEFDE